MAGIRLHEIGQPGQHAPASGFEAPFEMLTACHERVQRMLGLLARLRAHLQANGCDEQAAQAARDVMRYFDLAAPLHHQDEELHVFPPLLAGSDETLKAVVRRLQQDHLAMEVAWPKARAVLLRVAEAGQGVWTGFFPAEASLLDDFAGRYARHIDDEERLVYPAAQAGLGAEALHAMSADMMGRRGVKPVAPG